MKQAVLLGNPGTKRTIYLERAAAQAGLPLQVIDWKEWRKWQAEGSGEGSLGEGFANAEPAAAGLSGNEVFLKIDPPLWESCSLGELNRLTGQYLACLEELAHMAVRGYITFLNEPYVIGALLDKMACKKRLLLAGLPVTEPLRDRPEHQQEKFAPDRPERRLELFVSGGELGKSVPSPADAAKYKGMGNGGRRSAGGLLEQMKEQRVYQVFIKPVMGSGAAGVSAFRYQPSTGRMSLYTCALQSPEYGLINTKRLRHFSEEKEIVPLLDQILALDCIVERWYAKAEYRGLSYDLRAVVQDGAVDFILARLSKGPITNLHLNNHPLAVDQLGLPESVLDSIAELCRKTMACYPGLRSAGIDILLEKGSLKPRIIEMNAQGDLIYQDIYHENRIYCHQAEMMKKWLDNSYV